MPVKPRSEPTFNKFIRMSVALDQRIRDFRDSRKIPSEAEAIRQLLTFALDRQRTPTRRTVTPER